MRIGTYRTKPLDEMAHSLRRTLKYGSGRVARGDGELRRIKRAGWKLVRRQTAWTGAAVAGLAGAVYLTRRRNKRRRR